MTLSEIAQKYQLYVDDQSSLSTQETYDLANKKYHEILESRAWSFLVKNRTSDVQSVSVPYVAVQSDFLNFAQNYFDPYDAYPKTVVFVGTERTPYTVIPYNLRNNYYNQGNYVYYDSYNRRYYFTQQPTAANALDYDYVYRPTDMSASDVPVWANRSYDNAIYHGMCADFDLIQQTEKGKAYNKENMVEFQKIMNRMSLEDERLKDGY